MRQDEWRGYPRFVLSERNVRALLSKLDMPGSSCAIMSGYDGENIPFVIKIERDDAHYADRQPGAMHPDTEEALNGND